MIFIAGSGITLLGGPSVYQAKAAQARCVAMGEDLQGGEVGCRGPAGSAVAIANMLLRPIDEGAKNVVTKRIHFFIVF